MIDHIWTVLCTKSAIDRDSNNISLFEVLEQITAKGPAMGAEELAMIPVNCELVTIWSRSRDNRPCRGRGHLIFLSPTDAVMKEVEYDVDLTVHVRVRHRIGINGLAVREWGRHHFRVEVQDEGEQQWRTVSSVPLHILLEGERPEGPG